MALNKKAAAKKKPGSVKAKAPDKKKAKAAQTPKKPAKKVVAGSSKKGTAATKSSRPAVKSRSAPSKGKAVKTGKSTEKVKSAKPNVKASVKSVSVPAKASKKLPAKPSKPAASAAKSPAKTSSKTAGKSTQDLVKAKSAAGSKPASPATSTSSTKKAAPVKKDKVAPPVKTVKEKPAAKSNQEQVDPLHAKAEKVMRELEETMDLSKMRPRIQALSSAPKPLPKAPAQPIRLPEPANTTKVKFQLEFEFRSSPKILFASISDSSGLAGWFADEVITSDDVYTFVWEGSESHARLVALRDLQLVRFQWMDENDGTYFQFEIKEDDITSDIALIITDFANPGEKETTIRLWESQILKLRMLLGSL